MGSTYWRRSRAPSAVFLPPAPPAVVPVPADQLPEPTQVSGARDGVTRRHAGSDRPAELATADPSQVPPRDWSGMPANGAALRRVVAGAVVAVAAALGLAVVAPAAVVAMVVTLVVVLVARRLRG